LELEVSIEAGILANHILQLSQLHTKSEFAVSTEGIEL
jgi:hypothetical protein